MSGRKREILYLATFDPTVSATGTATRGKLFLRYLSTVYDVHLVHLAEKHDDGRDGDLIDRLSSLTRVGYSAGGYFLFSRSLLRAAREVIQRRDIDFIFADFEKAGWYASLLSRQFHIPYVYNSHNVEFLRYLDFAKRSRLRIPFVPYMYALERTGVQNALLTISISEKDAQTFKGWAPPGEILTMPCAFDETQFHPFYAEEAGAPPIVLMVGNYRNPGNREGATLLYEKVLPRVLAEHPDVIFRCVGRDFPPELQHPNLEAVGFVDDLTAEYRRAAVVVVPITIGGGIKIKTVEGLACGKYVLATPKGVEGIDAAGLKNLAVVPVEQFAPLINRVIANPVPKTDANWEKIQQGYGIRFQMTQIQAQIEKALERCPAQLAAA